MRISYTEHFFFSSNLNQSASFSFPSERMDATAVSSLQGVGRLRLCFLVKFYNNKFNQLSRTMNKL